MAYTPYIPKDDPIEGCPRITEEEYLELKTLSDEATEARKPYDSAVEACRRKHNEILSRYGKRTVDTMTVGGYPGAGWMISGHNVVRAIY